MGSHRVQWRGILYCRWCWNHPVYCYTNKLFFSNRTAADIIDEELLTALLGKSAIYIVTDGPTDKYVRGYIDEHFLLEHIDDFKKHFYICGPDKMVSAISNILTTHGANPEAVIVEK